jgi:hypothetical protein
MLASPSSGALATDEDDEPGNWQVLVKELLDELAASDDVGVEVDVTEETATDDTAVDDAATDEGAPLLAGATEDAGVGVEPPPPPPPQAVSRAVITSASGRLAEGIPIGFIESSLRYCRIFPHITLHYGFMKPISFGIYHIFMTLKQGYLIYEKIAPLGFYWIKNTLFMCCKIRGFCNQGVTSEEGVNQGALNSRPTAASLVALKAIQCGTLTASFCRNWR